MARFAAAVCVFIQRCMKTSMPAIQAGQRVRPEAAGPMTSSATPFFERRCAGKTI
jgi:hypothetical protein